MTKTAKTIECKACGRLEGHYLNCGNAPQEAINPLEFLTTDSVCAEEKCEEPVKNNSAKYCFDHGTTAAANARAYRKRAQKEES